MATSPSPSVAASVVSAAQRKEAFTDELFRSVKGAFDVFTIYLGDRLGYYQVMRDAGWLTPSELAFWAGTHERYAREWLEQQTVAGIVEVDDPTLPRLTSPPERSKSPLAKRKRTVIHCCCGSSSLDHRQTRRHR